MKHLFVSCIVLQMHCLDFNSWAHKCLALPVLKNAKNYEQVVSQSEYAQTLQEFIVQQTSMLCTENWVQAVPTTVTSFLKRPATACKPFVQRLLVPTQTIVAFHGDLHGDLHSLIRYLKTLHDQGILDNFTIQDKNFYLIFLGDYVDRGIYGCEVIYTLLHLALANPTQVFLIRGNHEDLGINVGYNFAQEVAAKYKNNQEVLTLINVFYNLLPVALYLGCNNNFLQCCHGGMEVGFNSHQLLDAPHYPLYYQWLNVLNQKTNALKTNCACFNPVLSYLADKEPETCFDIGFMWNDFKVEPTKNMLYNQGRGFVYNKDATIATLRAQSTSYNTVCGVIRAHQHAPYLTSMMQSILHLDDSGKPIKNEQHRAGVSTLWNPHATGSKLWPGIVCTLLVSPNIGYGNPYGSYPGFTFDTYALLTTKDRFEDWELQVYQL